MAQNEARLIYTLDRERTYHFLTFVLAVSAVTFVWLAWAIPEETRVAEFGSILGGRIAQGVIIAIGVGPLLAWLWWMRRYVRRITWLPAEQVVELTRFGYIGRMIWRLPASAFASASHRAGRADFLGTPSVRAPYRRLSVRGLPPLILDDQGTEHDAPALEAILAGRIPGTPF